MAENSFHDNVAVLTGASVGIGREMALQLADQGAKLALAAPRLVDRITRNAIEKGR